MSETEEPVAKRTAEFLPRAATVPVPVIDMGNCLTKLVASVVGGGVMGMVFGPIFSSSMLSSSVDRDPNLSWKTKVVQGWKEMGKAGVRMAKTFAVVGLVYSSSECTIEKIRGVHDNRNGIYAGCVAGGILGASGGPAAATTGCIGFALFSVGIDYLMTDADPRDSMVKDKDMNQMLLEQKETELFKAYERQSELLDDIDIEKLGLTDEQLQELDKMIEKDNPKWKE